MKQIPLLLLSAIFLCLSCTSSVENSYNLVPYPNSLVEKSGNFVIGTESKIILPVGAGEDLQLVAEQFTTQFQKASGIIIPIEFAQSTPAQSIVFTLNDGLAKEAYNLTVTKKNVIIEASHAAGFFYAIQTVKQLLPAAVYGKEVVAEEWSIPCVEIKDAPRFDYRGMHLDVARHFFGVEEVKRYIDIIAIHKVNTFHWHLTDDQGWRIEIKKYPRLTTVGSQRSGTVIKKEWGNYDNIPYGGFYTQDEIREIVDYAAQQFITVIPEVDLPGHMVAALASYPYLGCTGKNYEVSGTWGVLDDVLCVGKESTFTFIEDVLAEVMELFPSKYIHIGGDECPKTRWEKCPRCQNKIKELGLKSDDKFSAEHYLQSYTISRVERFLNERGRLIIGWDEILEGGAAPNATIMSWRGVDGGIEAAQHGHDVIMTPNSHFYFDYYQSLETDDEPFGIGGYVAVEKVYSFDPVFEQLDAAQQKHIIGIQANLWTEYIRDDKHLEYMLLPRLAALSEVQWTQSENKDWQRFLASMDHITDIYSTMDYSFARHIFELIGSYSIDPDKRGVLVTLETQGNAPIYYTIDGGEEILYKKPVSINHSCTFVANVKRENMQTKALTKTFVFNKATGNQITMNTNPKEKFAYSGGTVLVDGLRGSVDTDKGSWMGFNTGFWLGYEEEPLDVTITFPEATEISSVKAGTLTQIGNWIFPPVSMEVLALQDGAAEFISIAKEKFPVVGIQDRNLEITKEYGCSFDKISVKELRVKMEPLSVLPNWHGGKGKNAFLFVDELIAE